MNRDQAVDMRKNAISALKKVGLISSKWNPLPVKSNEPNVKGVLWKNTHNTVGWTEHKPFIGFTILLKMDPDTRPDAFTCVDKEMSTYIEELANIIRMNVDNTKQFESKVREVYHNHTEQYMSIETDEYKIIYHIQNDASGWNRPQLIFQAFFN